MSSQPEVRSGSTLVLAVLASGQFLMTLDSSVMNVSMATVAQDVGTTITGIQTAITLYTLVMASLMITGGKVGTILGRRARSVSDWSSTASARSPPDSPRTSRSYWWAGRCSKASARP